MLSNSSTRKKSGSITRFHIAAFIREPFEKISVESIVSGFRATGIFPFSRETVLGKLQPSAAVQEVQKRKVGRRVTSEQRLTLLEAEVVAEKLHRRTLEERICNLEASNEPAKRRRVTGNFLSLTRDETIEALEKKKKEKKRNRRRRNRE